MSLNQVEDENTDDSIVLSTQKPVTIMHLRETKVYCSSVVLSQYSDLLEKLLSSSKNVSVNMELISGIEDETYISFLTHIHNHSCIALVNEFNLKYVRIAADWQMNGFVDIYRKIMHTFIDQCVLLASDVFQWSDFADTCDIPVDSVIQYFLPYGTRYGSVFSTYRNELFVIRGNEKAYLNIQRKDANVSYRKVKAIEKESIQSTARIRLPPTHIGYFSPTRPSSTFSRMHSNGSFDGHSDGRQNGKLTVVSKDDSEYLTMFWDVVFVLLNYNVYQHPYITSKSALVKVLKQRPYLACWEQMGRIFTEEEKVILKVYINGTDAEFY